MTVMPRSVLIGLLALILFPAGCTLTGPGSAGEVTELEEARRAWKAQGTENYDMDLFRSCFCIGAGRMTVMVRGDSVSAIEQHDSWWTADLEWWEFIPTVEDLFDLIEDASTNADRLDVTYSEEFGYPLEVSIDWLEGAVDDEIHYTIDGVDLTPETEVLHLGIGEEAQLDGGIPVLFAELVEDSRCPHNADCIWAGRARVLLRVASRDIILTVGELTGEDTAAAETSGFRFTLIGVSPYPAEAGVEIPAASYRAHVVAEPIE